MFGKRLILLVSLLLSGAGGAVAGADYCDEARCFDSV